MKKIIALEQKNIASLYGQQFAITNPQDKSNF
jgi:hypothetical protein